MERGRSHSEKEEVMRRWIKMRRCKLELKLLKLRCTVIHLSYSEALFVLLIKHHTEAKIIIRI